MSCETCDDTRKVVESYTERTSAPWAWSGYTERERSEEVDCPDCVFLCLICNDSISELREHGFVPLRNYMNSEHWCNPRCLGQWFANRTYISDRDKLFTLLVAKHIYELECGCDFGDDSHSNGCHATVDKLNDMIESASEQLAGGGTE